MSKAQNISEREIRQISTDKICPDPRRICANIKRADVKRAAAKMKKCFGAPLPVCAAPACELYMLVSDEIRFRAALTLGYKSVPCEIFEENVVSGAKIALSDPRFLFNSIERLVSTSKRAGIDAEYACSESETSASAVVTVRRARRRDGFSSS